MPATSSLRISQERLIRRSWNSLRRQQPLLAESAETRRAHAEFGVKTAIEIGNIPKPAIESDVQNARRRLPIRLPGQAGAALPGPDFRPPHAALAPVPIRPQFFPRSPHWIRL